MTDPIRNPGAYDYITIAGSRSPFLVEVTGDGYKFRYNEVEATATIGASLTPLGTSLQEFQVTYFLCQAKHFDDWSAHRSMLTTPPGKKGKALQVEYPSLNEMGIDAAVVLGSSLMRKVTDDGLYAYDVKFKRYAPPKKTTLAIKGTDDDKKNPDGKKPQPEDEYDKMIRDLVAKRDAEAGK